MKNKPLQMSLLFDFYGDILTEKQREVFDLYYNEDLSLTEIAEHTGITRQGVRDSLVRAEHTLAELEQTLGLVAKRKARQQTDADLLARLDALDAQCAKGASLDSLRAGISEMRALIAALGSDNT